MKTTNKVLVGAGYTIIFGSHIYMLLSGGLDPTMATGHAIGNLFAGLMLVAGYNIKY